MPMPAPAAHAALEVAHEHGRHGRLQEAEAAFLAVLEAARERDPVAEMLAIHGLGITCGVAGRAFEAYVLMQASARHARALGDDVQLCKALGGLQGALSSIEALTSIDEVLEELRQALTRVPEGAIPWGWREYHEGLFFLTLSRRELVDARRHLDDYLETLRTHSTNDPTDDVVSLVFEARLAEAQGDLEGALAHLQATDALEVGRPNIALDIHVRRVQWLADLGRDDEARGLGEKALGAFEALQAHPETCFDRLDKGEVLARAFEKLGARDLAHRAYDIAAAAVIERMQQLDACARRLPELGLADAPQAQELVATRRRFQSEQRQLLERVAALLAEGGEDVLARLCSRDGAHVLICAWCERLRPVEGPWLPLGQYIPREGPVRITHGICPSCARAVTAAS